MKREKIYNYFYIVNNLLNGHFYLGVHSTDTLADGYFGSGLALKNAIKSYGKENFELVPLKFFKTRKELMDFEREIVNERLLTYYKGMCYNLKRGGEGGKERIYTDKEIREHHNECDRELYQKNKERKRSYNREYYLQNKENRREQQREYKHEYYLQNKERISQYDRARYQKKKAAKLATQATPGS